MGWPVNNKNILNTRKRTKRLVIFLDPDRLQIYIRKEFVSSQVDLCITSKKTNGRLLDVHSSWHKVWIQNRAGRSFYVLLLLLLLCTTITTAVEINPLIISAVKDFGGNLAGNLYDRNDIKLFIDDGRHFISSTTSKYER